MVQEAPPSPNQGIGPPPQGADDEIRRLRQELDDLYGRLQRFGGTDSIGHHRRHGDESHLSGTTGHTHNEYAENAQNESITGDWTFSGLLATSDFNIAGHQSSTLSSGAFTRTKTYHLLQPESGTSDTLDTINGGSGGDVIVIQVEDDADTITIAHETGNIQCAGSQDIVLNGHDDMAIFVYQSTIDKWIGGKMAGAIQTREIAIPVSDPGGDAITTGDSKMYVRMPASLEGYDLTDVAASLSTPSTSGAVTVMVRRSRRASATTRTNADMLSTAITIDQDEYDSNDAATPPAINASNDDVEEDDFIFIDIDGAGTGAKGLEVNLTFELPRP